MESPFYSKQGCEGKQAERQSNQIQRHHKDTRRDRRKGKVSGWQNNRHKKHTKVKKKQQQSGED